jgi:hypothetical protein
MVRALAAWVVAFCVAQAPAPAARYRASARIDPDRRLLYAVTENAPAVRAFRLESLKELPPVPLASKPSDVHLLLDAPSNRLILFRPRTTELEVVDAGERRTVRLGHVRRSGALRVDPSRSRIIHFSEEGLKLFDHEFRRKAEMAINQGVVSNVTRDGFMAHARLGPDGWIIQVLDLGSLRAVSSLRVSGVASPPDPQIGLNADWIVAPVASPPGTDLIVIERKLGRGYRVSLPAVALTEPELDGDEFFLLSSDGNQSIVVRVHLKERAAWRIPAGRAAALAVDASRATLYTLDPDGSIATLSTRSGRPFEVSPTPLDVQP